jgi:hypothetical protein
MEFLNQRSASLAAIFVALTCAATQANALEFGINIHQGSTPEINTQRAAIMKQRNIKSARMDIFYDQDQNPLRDQVMKIRANGGKVQAVIMTSQVWDNNCYQDLAYMEQKAYNETAVNVNKVKDLVHDFELLNEVQLAPQVLAETNVYNIGWDTSAYEGKPCVASFAATLRGMSRAIRDIRNQSGLPLRRILGIVGRDYGFLSFMQQKGVEFDVIGFHVYPKYDYPSMLSDPWFGTGGPYAQLAKFGKPIHVNEFNCGEISQAGYEDTPGRPLTEQCLKAVRKHLTDLINVDPAVANIESVYMYELVDEPRKASPQNRYGLMYDLARPKPGLRLYTAFAGGALTAEERGEITGRGLMADAEIDTRRQRRNSSAPNR